MSHRGTLRGFVVRSRLNSVLIKHDDHGDPMYADDARLGNRRERRRLAAEAINSTCEQREPIAASVT